MNADEQWDRVSPYSAEGFEITISAPRVVVMRGELTVRDPVSAVSPYLRRLHDLMGGGGKLTIDVTELVFVNSSGLRIFLDWIAWISAEPTERRYRLEIRTNPKIMWQVASLGPIMMIGGEFISRVNV